MRFTAFNSNTSKYVLFKSHISSLYWKRSDRHLSCIHMFIDPADLN